MGQPIFLFCHKSPINATKKCGAGETCSRINGSSFWHDSYGRGTAHPQRENDRRDGFAGAEPAIPGEKRRISCLWNGSG